MFVQVGESTQHLERVSASSPPDMSYNEVANHCQTLLLGKQKKIHNFISTYQKQDSSNSLILSYENKHQHYQITPYSPVDAGFQKVSYSLVIKSVSIFGHLDLIRVLKLKGFVLHICKMIISVATRNGYDKYKLVIAEWKPF